MILCSGDLLTLDDTVLAAGDPNQSTGEVQKPGSGVAGGDDLNASGLNRLNAIFSADNFYLCSASSCTTYCVINKSVKF